MKKVIISAFCVSIGISAMAQQEAMFTHYMYNTQAVNPAYAGSRDALTVTGLTRHQWVGFAGSPSTQTLTLHSPILNEKLGIGLSVLQDEIGPTTTTSGFLDLSYRTKVSKTGKLAFGLKGGVNARKSDLSALQLTEQNDNLFTNNVSKQALPNFGFGVYYYTDKFYAGVSTPRILENSLEKKNTTAVSTDATEKRHYYLIAGTVIKLSPSLDLKPTTLVKVVTGAPIQADLSAELTLQKKLTIGAMYRSLDAVGVLLGYQITEQFRVGYSFDWALTQLNQYNQGTHELMLRYDFIFRDKSKVKSPRYF